MKYFLLTLECQLCVLLINFHVEIAKIELDLKKIFDNINMIK